MATERNFITPAGLNVLTTANVVGNTVSTDYFSNTARSNQRPSLLLDFVKSQKLDPRITFKRSTVATYTDPKGNIQTVPVDTPRFEYLNGACQGLLMEEQRTNFFANERVIGFSIRPGTSIGPDNKAAYRWFIPAGSRVQYPNIGRPPASYSFSLAQGSSIDFVFTGYFGPCYGSPQLEPLFVIEVNSNDAGNNIYSTFQFDGTTGTNRGSGGNAQFSFPVATVVERHPNGMWKVTWMTRFTQDATIRNRMTCYFQPRDAAGNGDLTVGVADTGFEYACCQVEVGSQATSYIPTADNSATRASEIAYMDGSNFSSWYNPAGGSLYLEAKQTANVVSRGVCFIGSNEFTGNNSIHHTYIATGPQIGNELFVNGIARAQPFTPYTYGSTFKIVSTVSTIPSSYAYTYYYNGAQISYTGLSVVPLGVDRLVFNADRFTNGVLTSGTFNGLYRKIAFYSTGLSNNEMQALTQ